MIRHMHASMPIGLVAATEVAPSFGLGLAPSPLLLPAGLPGHVAGPYILLGPAGLPGQFAGPDICQVDGPGALQDAWSEGKVMPTLTGSMAICQQPE